MSFFATWSRLMMPGTMELIRRVWVACVLSLVLVQVAVSAYKILYSCTFEDVNACSLDVDSTRVTWMIGHYTTDPGQGPVTDHTWGTEEGKYVYTASGDMVNEGPLEPKLNTANFDLSTGEGMLSFYFFLWGSSDNAIKVFVHCSDDNEMLEVGEFKRSTRPMDSWARAEALITCNGSFLILFQAVHKANDSFVALDDITLSSTNTDAIVSVKTPSPKPKTETATAKDVNEPDVTSDQPKVPLSTMPTGGVQNRPHETMALSIILFLLALLFMLISVIVHCCIWHKRKKYSVKMRHKMNIHNSGYNCPVHTNHHPPGVIINMGDCKTPTGGQSDQNVEKASMRSSESGIVANGGGILSTLFGTSYRARSKTVPNKRSFEHYESIEMQSDGEEGDGEEKGKEKRVLSEAGGKRKKGFLGKARHFTRSNSLPSSPAANDFYESIDHTPRAQGPLAYQVTDLLPAAASSTSTLVGDAQDHRSSASSIPSIRSNHLKPPTLYDNLERRSPRLLSPASCNYTPPSHLNLSGSQCNLDSLYNTMSTSHGDIASLSSYETPTSHMDSPSSNPHVNPFFQSAKPGDMYDSLSRRRRTNPSPVAMDGAPSTPTQPSPASTPPSLYQAPQPKTVHVPPEYQTLDPDTVSDASFERSTSEDSASTYECPQTKQLQHVKSESSHDYEDLD